MPGPLRPVVMAPHGARPAPPGSILGPQMKPGAPGAVMRNVAELQTSHGGWCHGGVDLGTLVDLAPLCHDPCWLPNWWVKRFSKVHPGSPSP